MNTSFNLNKLEEIIEYEFDDDSLVLVALSHPGVQKREKECSKHFEKLEFLGDRVLGLSLASLLYETFPKESEGDLAVRMSTLAGTDFLISLAKNKKIIDCFNMPIDFFISTSKTSSSIADMMEAVFGAIFLDSDFKSVKKVIQKLFVDDIDKIIYKRKDSKTRLQELTQSKGIELPVYRLLQMRGASHNPIFEIEVIVCEITEIGTGNSKKTAEHDAATKILNVLENKSSECLECSNEENSNISKPVKISKRKNRGLN